MLMITLHINSCSAAVARTYDKICVTKKEGHPTVLWTVLQIEIDLTKYFFLLENDTVREDLRLLSENVRKD